MSRATVRQAITSYLAASNVTSLGSVIAYPEKVTGEGEFVAGETPGSASGAVVYVHLGGQEERRIGLGAPLGAPAAGLKMRAYQVELVCIFRSKKPSAAQVGADNDAFLDSLVDAILSNRTAGDPSAVFQWGESDTLGGVDVQVHSEMPRLIRQQASQVFSVIDVTALELVRS